MIPDASLPPAAVVDPNDDFDIREWVLRNIELNDPVELRRNELRSWAEAAGFANIDVWNLGDLDGWEMRFNRGTNTECSNVVEVERFLCYIARGCQCQIMPGQALLSIHWMTPVLSYLLRPKASNMARWPS